MSAPITPNATGGPSQPAPAAPPSRSEIERKLSFRSAAPPPSRTLSESPKKSKKQPPPGNLYSGNDSDTSSVTSQTYPQLTSPTYPSSPLLTPATGSVGGLSAIAERQARMSPAEEIDEDELEDVEEGEEGEEGEDSEEVEKEGGDLQRGMEGERVLKSGYLMKKQERRKAWKRKWFVLRTNKLAYYKDDREYSLKRVLDLKSVQTVAPVTIKKHSFSFGIVTAKRTFLAKASSQDEMDDWVRAINSARRRLSEREEEERARRTGTAPVAVPARERPEAIDTHQGTYSSVFISTAGSYTASPIAQSSYFTSLPGAQQSHLGGTPLTSPTSIPPSSPMDMTHSLTGQIAKMGMSPSTSSGPRLPQGRKVSASASARREPSASSLGSFDHHPSALGIHALQPTVSSDEDEPYFSEPGAALSVGTGSNPLNVQAAPVDPNKIILSAYLMKRSKGRGRKVWRKRWFYLTSQGLTYTKSHMDSRPLRFVPLTVVLDALEFQPNGSGSDEDDSDLDAPSESSLPAKPTRQFSMRGRDVSTPKRAQAGPSGAGAVDEHLFRVVTAKRTFVLCAPSEEDEIKWLAAFRALLNRQRDWSGSGEGPSATPMSPTMESTPRLSLPQPQMSTGVPTITQQPPTPASATSGLDVGTPSVNTAAGPPILGQPISTPTSPTPGQTGAGASVGSAAMAGRTRSATYIAKGAVADVVRRFHPENKDLPATPQHA